MHMTIKNEYIAREYKHLSGFLGGVLLLSRYVVVFGGKINPN